ncbi:hypothetical protein KDH_24510 [Dictyobacter sp. S3.2.2.5]|uniref:Uncharacterized protein n=1 Tax=Dictyobacter halimunensis TaxID=3026934 RepID=A0ABQ6FRG9_9CHLR|nr:hypothetical protein KDH_24510 [Dictyobacter sp. S3.2.2.5]
MAVADSHSKDKQAADSHILDTAVRLAMGDSHILDTVVRLVADNYGKSWEVKDSYSQDKLVHLAVGNIHDRALIHQIWDNMQHRASHLAAGNSLLDYYPEQALQTYEILFFSANV